VWIVAVTMLDEVDIVATTPFSKVGPTIPARVSRDVNSDVGKRVL
jgi:hypothetical protein